MTQVHFMAGTPRSGSTLLCNLLSQHPDVHVTGTSALYACVNSLVEALSNSPDVVSELEKVDGTYDRYLNSVRAFIQEWHSGHHEDVVIDKNRGWAHRSLLIGQLDPGAKLICPVRDPREIVASFEKQERRTAVFGSPVDQQIEEYASKIMSPDGMVGSAIKLCEDLLTRRIDVAWVKYEQFVEAPERIMNALTSELGLEPHVYDFENIENKATDLDAIYRNKFPHEGSGVLKPTAGTWRDYFSEDLAEKIAGVHPKFMRTFGYS